MGHNLTPSMNFSHVLNEISVNRKDPCEVVRELISNSYDANADKMIYFPLYKEHGFIFFDNGCGLDATKKINGITPYESFFSIGESTKRLSEDYVGYKCQGSKLCFASNKIVVITRCEGEKFWRIKEINDPRKTIDIGYDLAPVESEKPWSYLDTFFKNPDSRTESVVNFLDQTFFNENFATGTMVLVEEIDVEKFSNYFSPAKDGDVKKSYLYNYIKLYTKHGDVNLIKDEHGFRKEAQEMFLQHIKNMNSILQVWYKGELHSIHPGYKYLNMPDKASLKDIKGPLDVSRLSDGQFVSRFAAKTDIDSQVYTFILAVDGNRRALKGYSNLDRRGKSISGIRLTDQRGLFISAKGVRTCQYNELFHHPLLEEDFGALADANAQSHYMFVIDGPFYLVTNRNSLSNASLKILHEDNFVKKIKDFLNNAKSCESVFGDLCDVLKSLRVDAKRESQVKQLSNLKKGIRERDRFRITTVEALKEHLFVAPVKGEEHWVGALYSTLGHFVGNVDEKYKQFWLQPLTFSGQGIDSVGHTNKQPSLKDSDMNSIEYKYKFEDISFNHPLYITDYIVCWEMENIDNGVTIRDDFDCFGKIERIEDSDLFEITYEIKNIESKDGNWYSKNVTVICLKTLIEKTFNIVLTNPSS